MNCPKCDKEMVEEVRDTSHSREENQYERVIHHCKADDIWVTTEIPKI